LRDVSLNRSESKQESTLMTGLPLHAHTPPDQPVTPPAPTPQVPPEAPPTPGHPVPGPHELPGGTPAEVPVTPPSQPGPIA
jgi:hypothetical protein